MARVCCIVLWSVCERMRMWYLSYLSAAARGPALHSATVGELVTRNVD
jgi:hypothetical protein